MKILLLGPPRSRFLEFFAACGDEGANCETPLNAESPELQGVEYLVSYGYRHLLRKPVLDRVAQKAVNLHISLLPWNRGSDPNLWSFLDETPKGVTLHQVDDGLDTGPIFAQAEVAMESDDTLRSSYARLADRVEEIFFNAWPDLRRGKLMPRPQLTGGTCHRRAEKKPFEALLHQGWDTPVSTLIGKNKTPYRAAP